MVDPLTGKISDPATSFSHDNATWWGVDSVAYLRAATSGSTLSSIPTLSEVTSMPFATDQLTGNPTATSTTDCVQCPDPGLSGVAGVGIGIGASAGMAELASLVWLLFRERKKRAALQRHLAQPPQSGPPEAQPGDNYGNAGRPTEIHANQDAPRTELAS